MSLGSIIGGIVGAIGGFIYGGPVGALYGAYVGFAIGMVVDPMTPDMPTSGNPNPESTVMKSTIGPSIADLAGTAEIPGHLLIYGAERNEPIYAESQGGGKGGGSEDQQQVQGFNYYASWAVGIGAGPFDAYYAMYRNDEDLLWEGPIDRPDSGGEETIVIEGFGTVILYFGTADQVKNSKYGVLMDDSTLNSPFKHFAWAFFDDCLIGNYPRCPTITFLAKKIPNYSFIAHNSIQLFDSNPMGCLYFALTELAGLPTTWLDEDDFSSVALTLAVESKGICQLFREQISAIAYINNVLNHINGILIYGSDAKFHPKLIRDDYDINSLVSVNEDDMLDDPTISRRSWIDTVNEMKIQYNQIVDIERPDDIMANIYSLAGSTGKVIWGVYFNGKKLSYTGEYVTGTTMYSIMENDNDILAAVDKDSGAQLRLIDSNDFTLLNTHTPFNSYDITGIYQNIIQGRTSGEIIFNDEYGKYVVLDNMIRQSRGYYTTVVTGTDGNKYWKYTGVLNAWLSDLKPITGYLYSQHWEKIQDSLVDSPVSTWGIGSVRPGKGIQNCSRIDGNYLYTCYNESPYNLLYKINLNTLTLSTYKSEVLLAKRMWIDLGKLYTIGGNFTANVRKLNLSTLVTEATSPTLDGWFGDVIVVGNFVIAITDTYTGNSGIYKLNATDLTIIDSIIHTQENARVIKIDDIYFAVTHSNKIQIYNVTNLSLVDEITYGGSEIFTGSKEMIVVDRNLL